MISDNIEMCLGQCAYFTEKNYPEKPQKDFHCPLGTRVSFMTIFTS